MHAAGKASVLDELRARIRHLEEGCQHPCALLSTGIAQIDAHLKGGLRQGALHELIGGGADLRHGAAAALFAASLLGRERGFVLWVLRARDLFAPALARAGLHPDRVIYAETGDELAVLPVAEEGLRHKGLAAVVAEVSRFSLTASRRLQLAAEASGVAAFVIRRWMGKEEPHLSGTAAVTRWRLTAIASAPLEDGVPGVGDPRWRLELLRCRGAEPAIWIVEACDETGRLRLAADLADRSAEAEAQCAKAR